MNTTINNKKKLRIGIIFILLLTLFSQAFSVSVNISVEETVGVTKLLSGKYSIDTDGILTLHNPSLVSKVYEYSIPLKLDALIGISKTSIGNTSDRFDFNFERIKGYLLQPNETIQVGYHVYGLLNDNILTKLDGDSVLEYYSDFEFSGKTILNLQKPEREGQVYNATTGENILDEGNVSRRLVTAGIRNPTDFSYTAKELKIYGTDSSDAMFTNADLLQTFFNVTIKPFDFTEADFFDSGSISNSVYWMSSTVLIDTLISRNISSVYKVQSSGGGGSSGGSSGSGSFGGINLNNFKDAVLIKKGVDKTVIKNGEEFKVLLTIINVKDLEINNISILDEIPEDYEIKDVSEQVKITNGKLEFLLDTLDPYEAKVISYTLVNKEDLSGIIYLKPAELNYADYQYFSEGVLVIHDLLPNKKIFVQKEIDIVDDTFARITIKVRNLGSISLEDLLVSDIIDDDALIKELSQLPFERGSWRINKLLPGEEWEVSYLIERGYNSETLPNVFGVDQNNVYGTIISSEEIVTVFQDQPRTVEKVGMFVSIGLLIFYLLF